MANKNIIGYIVTTNYSGYTLIEYRRKTPRSRRFGVMRFEGIFMRVDGNSYNLQEGGRKTERVYGN